MVGLQGEIWLHFKRHIYISLVHFALTLLEVLNKRRVDFEMWFRNIFLHFQESGRTRTQSFILQIYEEYISILLFPTVILLQDTKSRKSLPWSIQVLGQLMCTLLFSHSAFPRRNIKTAFLQTLSRFLNWPERKTRLQGPVMSATGL